MARKDRPGAALGRWITLMSIFIGFAVSGVSELRGPLGRGEMADE